MSTLLILMFEVFIGWLVAFVIQIPLRRSKLRWPRVLFFLLKVLLIPVTAAVFMVIDWSLSYVYGHIILAAYVAIIGDVVASIIEYIVRRVSGNEEDRQGCKLWLVALVSFIVCAGLSTYGYKTSQKLVQKTFECRVDGLSREHRFAYITDVHGGSAQPPGDLHGLCDAINAADPEFVIIGGDVTDEITSYDNMVGVYDLLSTIEAPKYMVFGNHDRQPNAGYYGGRTYTDEDLEEAQKNAGITLLQDEFVQLADDLVLCGRLDRSMDARIAWDELENPYEGTYALVVADHQPYDYDQLNNGTAQMQLSGHTHAGQLWPLQAISNLIKMPVYGWYDDYSIPEYVSAGVSGWMIPFRLEQHCEWDLIQLLPKEEGSTESSEVTEIVAPAEPVEPVVPVDPVEPAESAVPTEPTEPTETV